MFSNENYSFRSGIPKKYYHLKTKNFSDWEIPPWELSIDTKKKVGEGSFGKVYMASWRKTDVIAKVIHVDVPQNKKMLCIREIDTLTKVHHPNVVQILGYIDSPFVIVMEHLPNGNLRDYIQNNAVGRNKRLSICLDVLKALGYLHNRRPMYVIHRDIKPTNIVMSKSGRAKIVDFGLSRFGNAPGTIYNGDSVDDSELTDNVGTTRYVAPEVINGHDYTTKVDIWSAGIVFKELLPSLKIIDDHMLKRNPGERMEALDLVPLFHDEKSKRISCIQYNSLLCFC